MNEEKEKVLTLKFFENTGSALNEIRNLNQQCIHSYSLYCMPSSCKLGGRDLSIFLLRAQLVLVTITVTKWNIKLKYNKWILKLAWQVLKQNLIFDTISIYFSVSISLLLQLSYYLILFNFILSYCPVIHRNFKN